MKRKVFKSAILNKEFAERGYVVVDIATKTIISDLINLFYKKDYNSYNKSKDFYATIYKENLQEKTEVYLKIMELTSSLTSDLINSYKPLFANFLYKKANSFNEVGIHQDWSYVDEREYNSLNVWLPLCNTSVENGGLFVLPKSHLVGFGLRSTPFENIYQNFKFQIQEKSVPIQTKLGEAVLYDSRLIHFSPPNNSKSDRIACASIMVPKESTPIHFYKEKDTIFKYETDTNFYLKYNPMSKPYINPVEIISDKALIENDAIIKYLKSL